MIQNPNNSFYKRIISAIFRCSGSVSYINNKSDLVFDPSSDLSSAYTFKTNEIVLNVMKKYAVIPVISQLFMDTPKLLYSRAML